MAKFNVHLLPDDIRISVDSGTTISKAAEQAGIYLTHPCGGHGTCGRCIVFANGNAVKACVTEIDCDMDIHIPDTVRLSGQSILTDFSLYDFNDNTKPLAEKIQVKLNLPTLDDSMSDSTRLINGVAAALGINTSQVLIETSCLKDIPNALRSNNFQIDVTIIHEKDCVTILSVDNTPLYGLAVDIGTTTVVTALCDLNTGYVLDTIGFPNPQAQYGSDVISRIVFTEENKNGTETLQNLIIETLSNSAKTLAKRVGINPKSIPVMTIAANTVMSNFLLGLQTDHLRREPYVPAATKFPWIRPYELNIPIMPHGRIIILPCISSYVGGDITAGIIATKLLTKGGLNMLVDVGTNGEMVLAGEGFAIACSSSAGPAFEGSGISCGSRAIQGAIDNVYYHNGHMVYDVIGGYNIKPKSICGSGLISFLSALLQKGTIDRSGRFTTQEKSFSISPGVTITEDDVFNLIRAKAAIYAGLKVLTNHMEMELSDIDNILIAGGFGRNLNIGYATNIGMFPPLEKERFNYVGNSSLVGAIMVLCNREIDSEQVADSVINLELSVGNIFMEEFTKACFLPHTDSSFYK